MSEVRWLEEPEDSNYLAAYSYVELLVDIDVAEQVVRLLKAAEVVTKRARDVLRASMLPLVPADDELVAYCIAQIESGREVSPLLLARGDDLIVADGYYTLCAVRHLDPDAEVRCKLI